MFKKFICLNLRLVFSNKSKVRSLVNQKLNCPILLNQQSFKQFTTSNSFVNLTSAKVEMANQQESDVKSSSNFSRLPKNVKPNHYFLTIRPDISTFTFSGTETVHVEVCESTKTIILNSLDIEIQKASFVIDNQEHQAVKIELNKENEIAKIEFEKELKVGSGQLMLEFTGVINDLMKGCYRCKYTTPDGEERYGLSTQFESTDCRRAFPCWDEPELKAKFDITLVAPKDRVALSNMNIIEETEDNSDKTKRVLKFATTPIMSTYLVCYIVGEYEFIEKHSKNGTKIRVYTGIGKTEQGKFALDTAVRCLDFYEEFFKINYILPKLDMVAIADFEMAMENFGLVTYRETSILFDPLNSSTSTKQWVAIVVCHELAHQWFGNLVTMKWWDNLWLNESFASFMEYFAVDHLLPEYNIWQEFINSAFISALSLDALNNSHPIEVPVNHPSEIDEIFDQISYEKGASIIRMLFHFIGYEDFQKGMHAYLTKWAYQNAVTEDLWNSLEQASKKSVKLIMNSWTSQKGFPVINVTSKQVGSNRVLTLTQEKFTFDGKLTEQDQQAKWIIPLSIITQTNPKAVKVLIEDRSQEVVLENVEPNEWVKLNPGMTSFIRVNYSTELLDSFHQSIADKSLCPIDRLNLQNDLFALAKSGKISSDRVLKLIELYQNEDQYPVWDSIIGCLSKFNKVLEYSDFQEVFHLYVRKLLAKIYEKLGNKPIAGEDHQKALLRAEVISLLVSCRDPQVLQDAKLQFESHIAKLTQIPPDLRAPIYRAVASDCDEKTFESFFQLYRETELNEEKNRIVRSLTATKDPARIQRLIEFALSTEVRSQDAVFVFISMSFNNKTSRDIVWNYFKENHNLFRTKYESGALIRHLAKHITENFASEERLQEVASFFAENPIPSAERAIQQSLEGIKLNSDWLSRDSSIIKNYLMKSSQL